MAEIAIGESLAWLAVSRPHIGVARVVADARDAGPGDALHTRRLELRRTAVVVGAPPAQAQFRIVVAGGAAGAAGAVGAEVLAFTDADGIVDRVVGLDSTDFAPALTASFGVLVDRTGILGLVTGSLDRLGPAEPGSAERAVRLHEPQRGFLRFVVPPGTAAHQALYGGGTSYLVLPVDPAMERDLLRHSGSGDPWERARVAHQLGNYPDADAIRRLRDLVLDGEVAIVRGLSGGRRTERPLRPPSQVAFDVLAELGVGVDRPAGYVDDFPYQLVLPGSAALAG